jgi:3-oxoacyl-[acyl-carrier-protein] synthase-3
MDTGDAWIRERTGIESRRYVRAGTSSSDLGIIAGRAALEDAGVEPAEIDYVICATQTPDQYFAGAATMIQHGIGISTVPALDLRQQCAGFAYGMQIADSLIRSGVARKVLLLGTDIHTAFMPFSDATWEAIYSDQDCRLDSEEDFAWNSRFRKLLVLFGDAAGAFVFGATEDEIGILGSEMHGDGANSQTLHVPGVGSRYRPMVSQEMVDEGLWVPAMDGRATYRFAVTRMPEVTTSLLSRCGYGVDDLDLLVMHQANLRINESCQRTLGLDASKVFNNIQKYGNTTSATLPLCFHEARQQGRVGSGDLVAFTALGAGLHWGAVLLRL